MDFVFHVVDGLRVIMLSLVVGVQDIIITNIVLSNVILLIFR
jgi:hypothetical protein